MMPPMKVVDALKWASSLLNKEGKEPIAADWLLGDVLGFKRSKLLGALDQTLTKAQQQQFEDYVHAHADGTPVQYITGKEEFYGRSYQVDPNVLIPRPETEELVHVVLERIRSHLPKHTAVNVVDIGTGSGVIAITLKLEEPSLTVTGVDIAWESLHVARENSNQLGANIRLVHGNLLDPFLNKQERFHVIVSNPPYIPEPILKTLSPMVKEYEPIHALVGGEDGYYFYRQMLTTLPNVLEKHAVIAFEVGHDQAEDVAGLIQQTFTEKKVEVEIVSDINGKKRFVIGLLTDNQVCLEE